MFKTAILICIGAALWHAFRGSSQHDYKKLEKQGWKDIDRLREKKREAKRLARLAKNRK